MEFEITVCPHGVGKPHGCRECIRGTLAESDTTEIAMSATEYTAWREHVHATLRTPGWESPELRALEEDE